MNKKQKKERLRVIDNAANKLYDVLFGRLESIVKIDAEDKMSSIAEFVADVFDTGHSIGYDEGYEDGKS